MSRIIHCGNYLEHGDKNTYEVHGFKTCIGCEEKYIQIQSPDDYCRECLVGRRGKLRLQEQKKGQKALASMTRPVRVMFVLLWLFICPLMILHFTFGKISPVFFWVLLLVPILSATVWGILEGLKIREFIATQQADLEKKIFNIYPYSQSELKDQAKKTRESFDNGY